MPAFPARPATPEGGLAQAAVWRREPHGATLERAELRLAADGGFTLRGQLVGVIDGRPSEVAYRIDCGSDAATRRLSLLQVHGGETRAIELRCGARGWRRDGRPAPELAGCRDVDLGLSPSTNLLPIRRLAADGDTFDIAAAWMQFPSLEITRSNQRYERLGERLWRYRNLDTGFTAEIEVDRFGLPVVYGGVWTRLAALEASPQP